MEFFNSPLNDGMPDGLSASEVEKLRHEGKVNINKERAGKSYWRILADNLFTFFNLIWLIVTIFICITGRFENLTFLAVVIPNILISTFQEMRAKRMVEKLSMATEPRATVVRDGTLRTIRATDIVLGDIVLIEMGKQVPSDAVVVSGIAEANESLLTGESDAIKKEPGDKILAGSFLVSGSIYAKVIKVGKDNYINKIEKAAKSFKAPNSNLFNDMNRLIKSIGIALIPMTIFKAFTNYLAISGGQGINWDIFTNTVLKTCTSVIGVIPSGIYLLVTLTLTLSVMSLAKKRTLVQDMYAIEMLASADVVCLDKTGTITDGTMSVTDYVILDGTSDEDFAVIMASIEGAERSVNNTSRALIAKFGKDVSRPVLEKIPFSSKRKYSSVSIAEVGTYSVGAPHFVPCPVSPEMEQRISAYAAEGERVLLVAKHRALGEEGIPLALIAISDTIRPNAKETIANFQEQGVTLKVISGDNAETVSTIAAKVGIKDADKYISCENISDEELILAAEKYAIFGRVTPEQKVLLVKTLKTNGHIVAMTGDGVNDTLALKESNCAIAMADGSEVARKISQIVLLDSDFASLPKVVKEGRRCINNVRQSAVLYFMKTIFVMLVTLLPFEFPLKPIQLFPLEFFIIGMPSVLLALEPSNKRIEGSFLQTALARSFPNALALATPIITLMIMRLPFSAWSGDYNDESFNSIAMAIVIVVGFINLACLCMPYTKWRALVVDLSFILLVIMTPLSIFLPLPAEYKDPFGFTEIFHNSQSVIVFIIMMTVAIYITILMQIFRGQIEKFFNRRILKQRLAGSILAPQAPSANQEEPKPKAEKKKKAKLNSGKGKK